MFIRKGTLIRAIYRSVLNREPDPEGLAHYQSRLRRGDSIEAILSDILYSTESSHRSGDHSQFGEFATFRYLSNPQPGGIVIDVGARGRDDSNSYDLMVRYRWRGLLIEPNPNYWPIIERDFQGLDYQLVRCAISDREGDAELHLNIHSEPSLLRSVATVDFEEFRPITVRTHRLANVLAECEIPNQFNLLSIDIEGMDIPVINDLLASSDYRPDWIWSEASDGGRTKTLADKGFYQLVQNKLPYRRANFSKSSA